MKPVCGPLTFSDIDLLLFKEHLTDQLRNHFPFEDLQLFGIIHPDELDELIKAIPFSERQRERARGCLQQGRPFWDRILHQAVMPLGNGAESFNIICRITGMPKTIGAEEGQWFLSLARENLKNWLKSAKDKALFQENKEIPNYLESFFRENDRDVTVIELAFYKEPGLEVEEIQDILAMAFGTRQVVFGGLADGSLWFLLPEFPEKKVQAGIKTALRALKGIGSSVRRFFVYDSVNGSSSIVPSKAFALGLRTRIFARTFGQGLLHELGLGPIEEFCSPDEHDLRATKSSLAAFIVFSSEAQRKGAKSLVENEGYFCNVGERGLFCIMPGACGSGGDALFEKCQDYFEKLQNIDKGAIAGFASPRQPLVSQRGLFYSSFLALYHAHLLGPGNLALFDHVTCNVHGDILFSWRDLPGAMACYRKGLSLEPKDVNLLNSLGACLADLSRLSEAERYFLKVLELEPDNVMALYNLSGIYLSKGRLEEAREAITKALAAGSLDLALLKRLLEIHVKEQDWDEAYNISRTILDNHPECSGPVLKLCARAALEAGNWQEARDLLKALLKKCPGDFEGILLLAKGFLDYEADVSTVERLLTRLDSKGLTRPQQKELHDLQERLAQASLNHVD